jgi:hypothetical protein
MEESEWDSRIAGSAESHAVRLTVSIPGRAPRRQMRAFAIVPMFRLKSPELQLAIPIRMVCRRSN